MSLTQLYPIPAPAGPDLGTAYAWGGDGAVGLNIVTTLNGSLTDEHGLSDGLSNPEDRRILGVIRRPADVILIGARTARAEQYSSPAGARLALVTATGDLDGLAIEDWRNTIVIVPAAVEPSRVAADALVLHADQDGPLTAAAAIRALREEGTGAILCEGGGHLANGVVASGLVTDLFLSIAPEFVGSGTSWLGSGANGAARTGFRLKHLIHDEESGAIYTRWRPTA